MRYVVFVKQVPDPASARVGDDGIVVRAGVPSVLNPYCESALAHVLSMRRQGDTVAAVSMGPPQAEAALRRCVELGADDATLLTDRDFAGADTWATARTLAAFIQKFEPDADLYVFGRQATDGDTGQVPYEVAALLGAQQFAYARSVEPGDQIVVHQDYDALDRAARAPKGSVVSFGTVEPGGVLPTIAGFARGRAAEIRRLGRVDVGLGAYSTGLKGSVTKIEATHPVKASRRNMKVEISDPASAAAFILKEAGR